MNIHPYHAAAPQPQQQVTFGDTFGYASRCLLFPDSQIRAPQVCVTKRPAMHACVLET